MSWQHLMAAGPFSHSKVADAVEELQTKVTNQRVVIPVKPPDVDTATGNGQGLFVVPDSMSGANITAVAAYVHAAGVTGTTDIQLRNATQTADILSTVITIDTTELDSSTAAAPAVIDTDEDDLTAGDVIWVDVDAVSSGTAATGLWVVLTITQQDYS